MTTSKRWAYAAAVIILVTSVSPLYAQGPGAPKGPAVVTVTTVEQKEFSDAIEALGTTKANETVTLTAKITETVKDVLFQDGQVVKKGDVLIILDSGEENANLRSAEAQADERRSAYQRAKGLEKQQIVSTATYEEKQAALRSAEASIQSIKSRINDAYIKAPFDGILGLREVSVGTLVKPGDQITTIDDLTQMKIDFDVPAVYLQQLKSGLAITGTVEGFEGRVFDGVIATIDTQVDSVTRSIKVRAYVPNTDMALRPGLLMNVTLHLNPRQAVVVPEGALTQQRDKTFVYLLHGEGDKLTVKKTEITRGARRLGEVEIAGGLEAGSRVVQDGAMMLKDGQDVRIQETKTGNPAETK